MGGGDVRRADAREVGDRLQRREVDDVAAGLLHGQDGRPVARVLHGDRLAGQHREQVPQPGGRPGGHHTSSGSTPVPACARGARRAGPAGSGGRAGRRTPVAASRTRPRARPDARPRRGGRRSTGCPRRAGPAGPPCGALAPARRRRGRAGPAPPRDPGAGPRAGPRSSPRRAAGPTPARRPTGPRPGRRRAGGCSAAGHRGRGCRPARVVVPGRRAAGRAARGSARSRRDGEHGEWPVEEGRKWPVRTGHLCDSMMAPMTAHDSP